MYRVISDVVQRPPVGLCAAEYSLEEGDVVTLHATSGYLSGCLGCQQYTTGKAFESSTLKLTIPYALLLLKRTKYNCIQI